MCTLYTVQCTVSFHICTACSENNEYLNIYLYLWCGFDLLNISFVLFSNS